MSSASPSSGRPDSEQHGIPHGQALATGSSTATAAGVTIDNSGTSWPVSAYRSLVVAINVTGGSDVTVTPLWSFLNAAADVANSAEQVAPAGQASRLIFQNQGDTLSGVTFTAAADSDFNYYVAGANLDPLPASTTPAVEDSYSPHQEFQLFSRDINGEWVSHWNANATVDTACLHNGFLASDGTQNARIAFRFNLGPHGSLWVFEVLYRAGPDGGQMSCYMASIPEDDPNYGATDNAGVLQDISTLNYVLAWKLDMFAAAITRNQIANPGFKGPIQNPFATTLFRIGGQVGDSLTSSVIESPPGLYAKIDGGPGMYAVKLVMENKTAASTSFVGRLQAFSVSRCDWAFA